jgi:hypothetical protein
VTTAPIDPIAAKQAIVEYCKKKGALAVGVADLAAIERIAPPGHRPTDLMPRVKSVISLGVGGQTAGAWTVPAKALAYFGSTETRGYKIAYGAAFFIESKFGVRSIPFSMHSCRSAWRLLHCRLPMASAVCRMPPRTCCRRHCIAPAVGSPTAAFPGSPATAIFSIVSQQPAATLSALPI